MSSVLYFRHLVEQLFSGPYLEGLDSKLRKNKDYKPKGPLTKTLLHVLPKAFAVVEVKIKELCKDYLDKKFKRMESSLEKYVEHSIGICLLVKAMFNGIYDIFLFVISVVICTAEITHVATGREFYKLTPLILNVFFERVLREDFDKRGGWKRLEKYIMNQKYDEYYEELVASKFVVSYELLGKIEAIFLADVRSNLFCKPPVRTSDVKIECLIREVISSVETSQLNNLISQNSREESSVSTQLETSDTSKANGNSFDFENSDENDCVCVIVSDVWKNRIRNIEEKLRELLSIFELLDAKAANRTIHYLSIEIFHLKLASSSKLRLTSRTHTPPLLRKTTHPPLQAQTQNNPPYYFIIDSSFFPTSFPHPTSVRPPKSHVFKFS
ncbi:uncharacterized protein NPIL_448221 [Nephila pilipes]|uniref:Uncharacterized protein n=1 Tax=Nephila pilipes TaxID=299642 RepID=A0A8X6IKV3_NEPPI|nr:uncharacterized protein NPIL_448221 [Nephila pilipes]